MNITRANIVGLLKPKPGKDDEAPSLTAEALLIAMVHPVVKKPRHANRLNSLLKTLTKHGRVLRVRDKEVVRYKLILS